MPTLHVPLHIALRLCVPAASMRERWRSIILCIWRTHAAVPADRWIAIRSAPKSVQRTPGQRLHADGQFRPSVQSKLHSTRSAGAHLDRLRRPSACLSTAVCHRPVSPSVRPARLSAQPVCPPSLRLSVLQPATLAQSPSPSFFGRPSPVHNPRRHSKPALRIAAQSPPRRPPAAPAAPPPPTAPRQPTCIRPSSKGTCDTSCRGTCQSVSHRPASPTTTTPQTRHNYLLAHLSPYPPRASARAVICSRDGHFQLGECCMVVILYIHT